MHGNSSGFALVLLASLILVGGVFTHFNGVQRQHLARLQQSLAGIQLAYSGVNGPNFYTRETPLAPTALPIRTFTNDPVQARAMDRADIRNYRRWHREAALRSKRAGFDVSRLVRTEQAKGF